MMKYAIHSDILSTCLPLPQHPATLTATRCESSAVSGRLSDERLLLDDSDTLTTDHHAFLLSFPSVEFLTVELELTSGLHGYCFIGIKTTTLCL